MTRSRKRCCRPWWLWLALVGAIAGCDASHASVEPGEASGESPRPSALTADDIALQIVDGDGYASALEKHRGHVVLVDFWATWCEPCTEKFPHVVELHRKHEADGLRVISLACNEVSETESVQQFLAEQGAEFDNLLTKFGNGTETNDTFAIHGVPYYKLYDRQGKLRFQFAEIYDDLEQGEAVEKIDQRVAELLAESP